MWKTSKELLKDYQNIKKGIDSEGTGNDEQGYDIDIDNDYDMENYDLNDSFASRPITPEFSEPFQSDINLGDTDENIFHNSRAKSNPLIYDFRIQ
uniref:Uncharacterized protein n=1 Tax=Panagrolaimus sp. ES5 TaxID=591445 RepID=A0AC34G6Z1_9BILA